MTGENIYKLICDGSKSNRMKAIENLSQAFTATNSTPDQLKLVEIPDQIANAALSHPFKNNDLATLWFKTIEALISELRTDNVSDREKTWIVLTHVARSPYSANYDEWRRQWPSMRERFIKTMNQNGQ